MPAPRPTLSEQDVHRFAERCLAPVGRDLVGIEAEWLAHDAADPAARVARDRLEDAAAALEDVRCRVTFEPGGQIELSSPPAPLAVACEILAADFDKLTSVLAARGIVVSGAGLDAARPPNRVIDTPRYSAMERYFDAAGPAGRVMMCSTAALQVNLDLGPAEGLERRWKLAHALGPTLVAAFANSPDAATGVRSGRMGAWRAIDRTRTAPVLDPGRSAADAWARYALDAHVMFVRTARRPWHSPSSLRFRDWLDCGHPLGWPDVGDLEYHYTTLFPPVRPRGHLELRMIDALPDPWWRVAVAVCAALIYDEEGALLAERATARTSNLWAEAASTAMTHPLLAQSARLCFRAAAESITRIGCDAQTHAALHSYIERYVLRGRCPADDRLESSTEPVRAHGDSNGTRNLTREGSWISRR